MTGAEHTQAAERLLADADRIANSDRFGTEQRTDAVLTRCAQAQVHATLALAAANNDVAKATYYVAGP